MNIDTTKIDGYEGMSSEEKIKALESYEYNDFSDENQRLKNAVSKANADAAEWKRKHHELLDDEDRKKQEADEKWAEMEQKLAEATRNNTISTHKASYLAMGYSEELAGEIAAALADGDTDKIYECQKKFIEVHDKEITKGALQNTPRPGAGSAGDMKEEYNKKAAEAQAKGDLSTAAYYMRLAQT